MRYVLPESEFAPFYKGYIDKTLDWKLMAGLIQQTNFAMDFFSTFPEERWEFGYAPEKWTPKEVFLHLIDAERIFSTRALWIAREPGVELSGFDEGIFVKNSNAMQRTKTSLMTEFLNVRNATVSLFESYSDVDLMKLGTANGTSISVRALGRIIAGHTLHHIDILKERYL